MIDTLVSLRYDLPGKKIVIFSKYSDFLDVLDVAIRQFGTAGGPPATFRLGTIPMRLDKFQSASQREKTLAKFYEDNGKPRILLVPIDLDAAFLELQSASIVMICEPLWTEEVRQKIIGQVKRPGKERVVRVLQHHCINSVFDSAIMRSCQKKSEVLHALRKPLMQRDGEEPWVIPHIRQMHMVPEQEISEV